MDAALVTEPVSPSFSSFKLGILTKDDHEALAAIFRRTVPLKDRRQGLHLVRQCFVGNAVAPTLQSLGIEKNYVERFAHYLWERGYVKHVADNRRFALDWSFYHFTDATPIHVPQACLDFELNVLKTIFKASAIVEDRRYHGRKYHQCFVGSQAVDNMAGNPRVGSRAKAVILGNILLDRGVFAHSVEQHRFLDAYLFYQFTIQRSTVPEVSKGLVREDSGRFSRPPRMPSFASTDSMQSASMAEDFDSGEEDNFYSTRLATLVKNSRQSSLRTDRIRSSIENSQAFSLSTIDEDGETCDEPESTNTEDGTGMKAFKAFDMFASDKLADSTDYFSINSINQRRALNRNTKHNRGALAVGQHLARIDEWSMDFQTRHDPKPSAQRVTFVETESAELPNLLT